MNNEKKYMENISSLIKFNKSEVIDYENFGQLSKILKINGTIQEDQINLVNERYNLDK